MSIGDLWATIWPILLGIATGLLLLWGALLIVLWRAKPDNRQAREALRLLPDVVRLLRRLAADPDVPRGVRLRLVLLLIYLAMPIDLVPDFDPALGRPPCGTAGPRQALARQPGRTRCHPPTRAPTVTAGLTTVGRILRVDPQ
jgi:Protein of unknown function (DUF1232)